MPKPQHCMITRYISFIVIVFVRATKHLLNDKKFTGILSDGHFFTLQSAGKSFWAFFGS
jgi:hypothetical protein